MDLRFYKDMRIAKTPFQDLQKSISSPPQWTKSTGMDIWDALMAAYVYGTCK